MAVAGAAVLLVALAIAWYRYVFPRPPRVELPSRPVVLHPGERIMIFAPHSDDETLGAGGLIQRALKTGAIVRVVLITNGDGFTLAAEDEFNSVRLTPERYIQFAYIRQGESLAALESLGLPAGNVTFLGFPDRGTPDEWEYHWRRSDPYTSRYTRLSHSPYRNSYVKDAPFCGAALASELRSLLDEFKPDTIVLPHPNDMHPDHWGTYNFVMYALAQLEAPNGRRNLFERQPRLLHYLVHRGNWPAPKGYLPRAELVPPAPLLHVGTSWRAFPLDRQEAEEKHRAILRYRSQVQVMRRYLLSFARSNDLFGVLPPPPTLTSIAQPVIVDPTEDTVGREMEGGADLEQVELWEKGGYVYLRLSTRAKPTLASSYLVHVHALPAALDDPPLATDIRLRWVRGRLEAFTRPAPGKPSRSAGLPVQTAGRTVTVRLPRGVVGPWHRLFVAAESYTGALRVDRTAWRYVVAQ